MRRDGVAGFVINTFYKYIGLKGIYRPKEENIIILASGPQHLYRSFMPTPPSSEQLIIVSNISAPVML
jgi:hypothetical protein